MLKTTKNQLTETLKGKGYALIESQNWADWTFVKDEFRLYISLEYKSMLFVLQLNERIAEPFYRAYSDAHIRIAVDDIIPHMEDILLEDAAKRRADKWIRKPSTCAV